MYLYSISFKSLFYSYHKLWNHAMKRICYIYVKFFKTRENKSKYFLLLRGKPGLENKNFRIFLL